MTVHADLAFDATRSQDHTPLRDHLVAMVHGAELEKEPFCHIYMEGIFPASMYPTLLRSLPPKAHYEPLNLRRWARADGTSTRDLLYFTPENLEKLPAEAAGLWRSVLRALTDGHFKRALFARLAPDMALRFSTTEARVPDLQCVYDLCLVRDTEDYRISRIRTGSIIL